MKERVVVRDHLATRVTPSTDHSASGRLRTVEQAAADLCVSPHTIRAWIARRKVGCVRLGRAIRISAAEIERLVERGTIPPIDRD